MEVLLRGHGGNGGATAVLIRCHGGHGDAAATPLQIGPTRSGDVAATPLKIGPTRGGTVEVLNMFNHGGMPSGPCALDGFNVFS